MVEDDFPDLRGRSPQGERGLKLIGYNPTRETESRSPQGERGLKYSFQYYRMCQPRSLSARRAWIEIIIIKASENNTKVALRKESVD